MSAWQPIESAPHDGTWIILDLERHGHMWEPVVGRWNPKTFETGTYQWECIERTPREMCADTPEDEIFNYWSEGRADRWMPLPAPPEAA